MYGGFPDPSGEPILDGGDEVRIIPVDYKSAIVNHAHTSNHQIHWDNADLIAPVKNWFPRRIREAIEIYRHDTVHQDIGFKLSDSWGPLIKTKQTPRAVGSSLPETH